GPRAPDRRNVAHDRTPLRRSVEGVGLARRGVDLEDPVSIEIADLDLVDERVLAPVQLAREELLPARREQCDHTLVVRGHGETRGSAPEWKRLRIAQP